MITHRKLLWQPLPSSTGLSWCPNLRSFKDEEKGREEDKHEEEGDEKKEKLIQKYIQDWL